MPDAAYGNAHSRGLRWQHCMTIPRVLTRDQAGHILQNPVSELAARRGAAVTATDGAEQAVDACSTWLLPLAGTSLWALTAG